MHRVADDTRNAPGATRRPRVLTLALGWDRPGGVNRYVQDLHRAADRDGGTGHTVVLGPAESAPSGVTAAVGDTAPLRTRLLSFARTAGRWGTHCDVVDVHFAFLAFLPVVLGRLRTKPLVVHFHGPWALESRGAGEANRVVLGVKRALERAVYRRAHRLVVLSDAFAHLLVQEYGVDPDRVRVVPPGVDLEKFTRGRAAARERLGLDAGRRVVFTARRLVPRMGLDVLLQAWQRQPRRPDDLLLIAGEGPERDALTALVRQAGLEGSVRLLGRLGEEELVEHYRAADVCVVPSLELEGFGLVVLESLACGTPVVVTDVGGLPDVVRELDASLVVPPGSPDALAHRLSAALDGRRPGAEDCRRHAETFSWQHTVTQHRHVYAEALHEAAPRR